MCRFQIADCLEQIEIVAYTNFKVVHATHVHVFGDFESVRGTNISTLGKKTF